MNALRLPLLRLDFATAAVLLVPFALVGFDFRHSLNLQAVGITLLVLWAAMPSLTAPGLARRLGEIPRRPAVGLILYVTATGLGFVVALINGNDFYLTAAQALSMGLLVAAAVPALMVGEDRRADRFRNGLLAGAGIGAAIQIAWGLFCFATGSGPTRLFLPNAVSIVGAALMVVALGTTSTGSAQASTRRLARAAVTLVLIVIVGSSLRSLWLLAPLTIGSATVLWRGWNLKTLALILAMSGGLAVGFAGVRAGFTTWVDRHDEDLIATSPRALFQAEMESRSPSLEMGLKPGPRRRISSAVVTLPNDVPGWLLKVRSEIHGHASATVSLRFFDDSGRDLGRISAQIFPTKGERVFLGAGSSPQGYSEVKLMLISKAGEDQGQWTLSEIRCVPIHSGFMAKFARSMVIASLRFDGLSRVLRTGDLEQDATLSFRGHEAREALRTIADGSWIEQLFGRGFGAKVKLDVFGFDNRGHRVYFEDENYLHNWYLFLLLKLGLVGTVLVLVAVVLWLADSVARLRNASNVSARSLPAAATVIWCVYLTWSLTSPEILDFRIAPLWGWLIAATVASKREP